MKDCLICANETLHELPMHDKDVLAHVAHDIIRGLVSTLNSGLKNFRPRQRGICIVERCAQVVEAPCTACRKTDCQRCLIAADLRAAEDRINTDRAEELVALGVDDQDLEEILDKIVESLCKEHFPFGAVLVGEWYSQRNFLVSPTSSTIIDS